MGLAWCGLDVMNCEEVCSGDVSAYSGDVSELLNSTQTTDDCILECEMLNIARQPASVRTYAELLYFAFIPAYQVICVALCATFPIHGKRLDQLYANQAEMMNLRMSQIKDNEKLA